MTSNKNLNAAAQNPENEYYTELGDIGKELHHYKDYFEGKTILCNCDDPYESNFFKYFAANFNDFKLKKLVTTCYTSSPEVGTQINVFKILGLSEEPPRKALKIEINEVDDYNGDGAVDLTDVEWLLKNDKNVLSELEGDGDFGSDECVELLDQADIVVTNPPFSEYVRYIKLLVDHNKDFIIMGRQSKITDKQLFELLQSGKVWLGYYYGEAKFRVPDYYPPRNTRYWVDETGQKWRSFGDICWFTSFEIDRHHESLVEDLYKKYNNKEYPKYDNFDCIYVSHLKEIPKDYMGLMAVPITFMYRYNPEEFELVGLDRYTIPKQYQVGGRGAINGKSTFAKIIVRRR